jgi:hypothetical protein
MNQNRLPPALLVPLAALVVLTSALPACGGSAAKSPGTQEAKREVAVDEKVPTAEDFAHPAVVRILNEIPEGLSRVHVPGTVAITCYLARVNPPGVLSGHTPSVAITCLGRY